MSRKREREPDCDSDQDTSAHQDEAREKRNSGGSSGKQHRQKKPRGKPSMSGYKGVTLAGNRWAAQATMEGKRHHLGTFVSPEEAAVAVQHFEATGEKIR